MYGGKKMEFFDDETRKAISERLSTMQDEVTLVFFDKKSQLNEHIKELLKQFSAMNDKLLLEIKEHDSEEAKREGIVDAPVTVVKSANIKGKIHYYGIPSGYEFASLLEIVIGASTGRINELPSTVEFLNSLSKPLKLEVFVTPTCPHCPTSALVSYKFAMLSSKVTSMVIEASEFPEWSNRYSVTGVPKTVLNDGEGEYVGGYPEDMAVAKIKELLG